MTNDEAARHGRPATSTNPVAEHDNTRLGEADLIALVSELDRRVCALEAERDAPLEQKRERRHELDRRVVLGLRDVDRAVTRYRTGPRVRFMPPNPRRRV